jgi:excisionase family DNA binding protein
MIDSLTSDVLVPQWYLAAIGVASVLVCLVVFVVMSWLWQRYTLQKIRLRRSGTGTAKTVAKVKTTKTVAKSPLPAATPVAARAKSETSRVVLGQSGSVTVGKTPPGQPVPVVVAPAPTTPPAPGGKEPDIVETMSIAAAAKRLKLAKSTVRDYIRAGKLEAEQVDGVWQIPVRSVKQLIRSRSR